MKKTLPVIFLLLFSLILPATTIMGIYIPPQGEKPDGVLIFIGKFSTKTNNGGFFFINGLPPGNYILKVKGQSYGKIRVKGEILRIWVDGVERAFYITRNFPTPPEEKITKQSYSLKDDLENYPALQYYQGEISFQGLTRQEFFLSRNRATSPNPIPYTLGKAVEIKVGYPAAEVKVVEGPSLRPSSRIIFLYGKTPERERARSLSFPYAEGNLALYRGNYGGFVSLAYRDENYSNPENQSIKETIGFVSLQAQGFRGFFQNRRVDYKNLRDRPYFPLSSSRNGNLKERGYGLSFSWGGFSASLSDFSCTKELNPTQPSPYFLFDEVLFLKENSNFQEKVTRHIISVNSSLLFYTSSFLGLNNTFFLGGEFFIKEVKGRRSPHAEVSLYNGKPGFLYLRTEDLFHYKNYSAGLTLSDTITSGNVNLFFSAGYRAEWFKAISSQGEGVQFLDLAQQGAAVPDFKSKIFHMIAFAGGLSYDPFRNGFLIVRVYGSFRSIPVPESLSYRASSTLSYGKYLWEDDGDLIPEEGEFSPLYNYAAQASLKAPSLYPPGLGPSRFYRLGGGISSDLPMGLSADLDFFYVKTTLPVVDIPLIWKDGKWNLVSWGDWEEGGQFPMQYGGQKWFALEEGKYFNGYYQSLNLISVERSWKEFVLSLRKSGKISFAFQLNIRSNLFSINQNLYPLDPGNLHFTVTQPYGPSPNGPYRSPVLSSRWGVLFSISWRPDDWTLNATFRARDGYILPVYYIDTSTLRAGLYDYPQGLAAPFSEFRLPTFWRLDLNLTKEFNLRWFTARTFIRITNILNSRIPSEEMEDVLIQDFLSPRWYYPPRGIILGIILTR